MCQPSFQEQHSDKPFVNVQISTLIPDVTHLTEPMCNNSSIVYARKKKHVQCRVTRTDASLVNSNAAS